MNWFIVVVSIVASLNDVSCESWPNVGSPKSVTRINAKECVLSNLDFNNIQNLPSNRYHAIGEAVLCRA
jgi:hypothetical protein